MAYSSDGTRLASWEDRRHDQDPGRRHGPVDRGRPPSGGVSAGAWSPDDKLLATGHDDGTVTISDAQAGDKIATLRGHVD